MNWKLWLCIGVAVFVMHLMVILIISRIHELGEPPAPPPKEQSFTTGRYTYVDNQGKKVQVVQEFKVSTEFAKPEMLKLLPPPPTEQPAPAPVP
jgi:hypothetical protein